MNIISVGYTMDFASCHDVLKEVVCKKLGIPNLDAYVIPDTVHSGVWYHPKVKQISDQCISEPGLEAWYKKHVTVDKIYLRAFYITSKLLIFEAYSGSDNFFIVASNMTSGTATTLHKKNALRGYYGERYEIERFEVPATTYIDRK